MLLLLMLIIVKGDIIRNDRDIVDGVVCPKQKPIYGEIFGSSETVCLVKNEIIGNGKFYDINFMCWLKCDFYITNTYVFLYG